MPGKTPALRPAGEAIGAAAGGPTNPGGGSGTANCGFAPSTTCSTAKAIRRNRRRTGHRHCHVPQISIGYVRVAAARHRLHSHCSCRAGHLRGIRVGQLRGDALGNCGLIGIEGCGGWHISWHQGIRRRGRSNRQCHERQRHGHCQAECRRLRDRGSSVGRGATGRRQRPSQPRS